MNRLLAVISIVLLMVSSGIFASLYTRSIFEQVLSEHREEDRLQTLAFSQRLLERLDQQDLEGARAEALSVSNSIIYRMDHLEAYQLTWSEACFVHQAIAEYRKSTPEKYVPTTEFDRAIQEILSLWSSAKCQ